MTIRLSPADIAYIKANAFPSEPNKLRAILRILPGNKEDIAAELGFKYVQLNRYAAGEDLLMSTAYRISEPLGLSVCDIWPRSPKAKAQRKSKARKNGKAKSGNGPKAMVA